MPALPIYTLPFTLRPVGKTPKLSTSHQINLYVIRKPSAGNSQTTLNSTGKPMSAFKSAFFLRQSVNSDASCPYSPSYKISHVCLITESSIRVVDTESWDERLWEIAQLGNHTVAGVVVLGNEMNMFAIVETNSIVLHLDTAKEVYSIPNSKILTFDYDLDHLYLSVMRRSPTPGCLIQVLSLSHSTQALSRTSQFSCPDTVISLRHFLDRLLGTTDSSVYIWSRDTGEMMCELNLPGSHLLLCHCVRSRDHHTFVCVSSGTTLYSLTLSDKMDEQKFVGEVQTQGNVFVCGFYAVFCQTGVIFVYNLISELLAAKFYIPGMEVVDVCPDYPVFLIKSEHCLQICYIDFKTET